MSINGINSPLGNLGSLARPETARTGTDRATGNLPSPTNAQAVANAAAQANARAAALKPQAPIGAANTAQSAVPSEAPAGTDPSLWSVLTSEERTFFAKSAAMGPLTYGRIKAATAQTPPAARGVRLDVRA